MSEVKVYKSGKGFGQTHLIRKQAGVQESSGPVSGRTRPARYQFPTFKSRLRFPIDGRDPAVQNQPDPIRSCLLTGSGFGQTDPVRKQAGAQASSGPLLASASVPIRI